MTISNPCNCVDGYVEDCTWSTELNLLVPPFCQNCEIGKKLRIDWGNTEIVRDHEKKLKQVKIDRALKDSGVSPRFREKRISDLVDSPILQSTCLAYINSWDEKKNQWQGLYFSWFAWRGKTHTACAIVNELIERHVVAPMFVNLADIADRVRKTFDEKEKSDDSKLFEKLKTCELLVIDDLGTEKWSEWIEEKLFSIINFRYDNQLPMIITSNLKISELKYNTRIISRLYEMSEQIGFTSHLDRRIKQ